MSLYRSRKNCLPYLKAKRYPKTKKWTSSMLFSSLIITARISISDAYRSFTKKEIIENSEFIERTKIRKIVNGKIS